MSIDAVIQYVSMQSEDELLLILAPRWDKQMRAFTIPGVPRLRIKNYTRLPSVGWAVWGGSSTVHIVEAPGREWLYRRQADGTLKEVERDKG